MTERRDLVRNLQSLVRIPSFRDSLDVSRWVRNELEGLGYRVRSDDDGNLVTETGKGPGFLLNSHMDTVEPGEGWKHEPFGGEIEGGRVYGRGASDCKAGVAAMIEIARALRQEPPKKRVVLTFTAFEEGYPLEKNGIYRILPHLKNIEKGIIVEPTVMDRGMGVAIGCRGSMRYDVQILGERGHSAHTPTSVNPIYKFPRFLGELRKIPEKSMTIAMLGEDVRDRTAVTQIWAREGGNVFPGKCTVTVERRSLPGEKPRDFRGRLEAGCKKSLGKDFRIEEKSGLQGYLFKDSELLRMCLESIKSAGCRPEARFAKGRIDGSILYNFAGIGTFMLGPGNITEAHKVDEYCEIEGLRKGTEAVLGVIKLWDKT